MTHVRVQLPPRKDSGSSGSCRRVEVLSREEGVIVVEIFLNVARYLVIFKRKRETGSGSFGEGRMLTHNRAMQKEWRCFA